MTPSTRNSSSNHGNNRSSPLQSQNWLDHLASFETHFGRFLWDILGVSLIAIALVTLLGISGISKGSLLGTWTSLLKIWLGFGSILFVLTIAALGVITFRTIRRSIKMRWGRVIALELVFFFSLAVLSVINKNHLGEGNMWGGQVGWGLSMLANHFLGPVWGGFIIFMGWGLSFITAFGLWHPFEAWMLKLSGESPFPLSGESNPEIPVVSHISKEHENTISGNEKKRQMEKLPPEFRKSFKIPEIPGKQVSIKFSRADCLPPLSVLLGEQTVRPDERTINQTAGQIEKTLSEFGIPAKVIGFRIGPTVTQFAVQPGFIKKGIEEDAQQMKVRVAQIAGLHKDLALSLSAERLRIEAPVPGRAYVGIEVPNSRSSMVRLRPILELEKFYKNDSPLMIALGRDVSGNPVVADLAHMPHLLIAGTTGSGKSVCIAALAICLVMNNSPEDLRMVMIDSKMVELIRFNGLPHLYGKVETDVQRILGVLRWLVVEMEHRYKLLEAAKARDIDAYNHQLRRRKEVQTLPRIVVFIDEMADLMMSAPDQTESNLVRLAQMARATGIHLVVATQRPSTDVVTGLIKANFPARLAFSVTSHIDSRVILDLPGAETLLGRGDLLFMNPEIGNPIRAQGVMVSDQEIERVIAHWQKTLPQKDIRSPWESMLNETTSEDGDDILIEKAVTIIKKERRVSASMLQRRLHIGYPRAARLLDQMEEMGAVGPSLGGGRDREVLIDLDEENESSSNIENP